MSSVRHALHCYILTYCYVLSLVRSPPDKTAGNFHPVQLVGGNIDENESTRNLIKNVIVRHDIDNKSGRLVVA